MKQLVEFARVSLNANETKKVEFKVSMKQLAFHDLSMDQVVEPGVMDVYIGASSEDNRLKSTFTIIGEKLVLDRKVFKSEVTISEL